MACSTRCCVILVALVAVLAYFGLQKTTVSFEFSVSDIKSDPQTVFELFRDPKDLPNIHPMLTKGRDKVEVLSTEQQEGGVEVVHFNLPSYRYFQTSITWVIDPSSLSIDSKFIGPLGIVNGRLRWTFVPDESEGSVWTRMTESTKVTTPKILAFAAYQIRDSHLGMVQALKEVVKGREKEQP